MPPLQIVWSWRARAGALGFAAALAAITAWAVVDPKASAWTVAAGGAFTLVCALLAAETCWFRVVVDDKGLRRRSLRGADALAWGEIRGVRLVASRHEGMSIVHTRTDDFDEAFHARLVAERGRSWDFNGWMTGFGALLAIARERKLPPDLAPPAPERPLVVKTLRALDRANDIGFQIVAGFSLLFVLFVASVGIVAGGDIDLTGNFFLDLLLVALGLLGCVGLVRSLAGVLRARRFASSGVTAGERRTAWMMEAAGLIGGVLLLVAFVPRALGGAGEWVDWLLVAFGVVMIGGALRD